MSWTRRFFNLLRSNRHSRDLDRELAFHLAERVDDLVAAGMTREIAEREARRRFGNYGAQKERTRDADIFTWLDSIIDDMRYAVRMLRHSPAFALVAILSLALGIGANTAIFTLVNAVMLRSLPVAHPEELVQITMRRESAFTNPIWEQIRDNQKIFNGAFAYSAMRFNLVASGEVRYADRQPREWRLLPHAWRSAGARTTVLRRRRPARVLADRRVERRVLAIGVRRRPERARENDLAQLASVSDRRRRASWIRRTRRRSRHAGVRADLHRARVPRAKHLSRSPQRLVAHADGAHAPWMSSRLSSECSQCARRPGVRRDGAAALRPEQQRNYLKNTLAAEPARTVSPICG